MTTVTRESGTNNVNDQREEDKALTSYDQLRAYEGDADRVRISQKGIAGTFYRLTCGARSPVVISCP